MKTTRSKSLCRLAALSAAFAVLLAGPAAAVDGEILINQARVNAGGITPGDDPGFPATLSRPGRYKLSGNLRVTTGTSAIVVTGNNVTLDLNGFTISSSSGMGITGVFMALATGLRVMNGTITGFPTGGIDADAFTVVENMRLVANGHNLRLGGESHVRDSTIANSNSTFPNPAAGVRCYAMCVIENNIITGNLGVGVFSEGGGGTVRGNVIVGNGGVGVLSSGTTTGLGNNILVGNNNGGNQVSALVPPLHPNVCNPACP